MNNLIKEHEINFLMNFKKGYLLNIREGLTVRSAHPHALELSIISMQEFHRKPKYIPCAWNINAKTPNLINKTTYKPSISIFRKYTNTVKWSLTRMKVSTPGLIRLYWLFLSTCSCGLDLHSFSFRTVVPGSAVQNLSEDDDGSCG